MLDHIGLAVSDVAQSKRFFEAALEPLGYQILMDFGEAIGLGQSGKPDFWIARGKIATPTHVAFVAPNRATVAAFYNAALAAGGAIMGRPGYGRNITQTILAPSCTTQMATTLRRYAINLK